MEDGHTANGRLVHGGGVFDRLALFAESLLRDVSELVHSVDGHHQMVDVDQESKERHAHPSLADDHERVFWLQVPGELVLGFLLLLVRVITIFLLFRDLFLSFVAVCSRELQSLCVSGEHI